MQSAGEDQQNGQAGNHIFKTSHIFILLED